MPVDPNSSTMGELLKLEQEINARLEALEPLGAVHPVKVKNTYADGSTKTWWLQIDEQQQ